MTNAEFNEMFREKTKAFAVRVLQFLETITFNTCTKIMSNQLGKSATSVGANFRAFCRGRSKAEKFSKICIVVEEADESVYWLELFTKTGYGDKNELSYLGTETLERRERKRFPLSLSPALSPSHSLTFPTLYP